MKVNLCLTSYLLKVTINRKRDLRDSRISCWRGFISAVAKDFAGEKELLMKYNYKLSL